MGQQDEKKCVKSKGHMHELCIISTVQLIFAIYIFQSRLILVEFLKIFLGHIEIDPLSTKVGQCLVHCITNGVVGCLDAVGSPERSRREVITLMKVVLGLICCLVCCTVKMSFPSEWSEQKSVLISTVGIDVGIEFLVFLS